MDDFELEQEQTRSEVATYLQKLADGLRRGNSMTFVVADQSATINPPEHLQVRMESASDSSWLGGEEGRSFVLELGWEADEVDADEELSIINQPETSRAGESARTAGR